MDFDLTQALASRRGMAAGFSASLPDLAVAGLVYALFHVGGRHADRASVRVSERRRRRRIGDPVAVGGHEGTVEEIETRATSTRTSDGRRVGITNATLFSQSVTVDTACPRRRLQHDVGVGCGDDLGRARAVMQDAPRAAEGVLVVDLAGPSVDLRARWWTEPPRRGDVVASRDRVLGALREAPQGAGIGLPYLTTQVPFHDQTEEADGDRARQREGWPPAPRRLVGALRARRGGSGEARP